MKNQNLTFGLPTFWEDMSRDERVEYLYHTRYLAGYRVA